MVDDWKPIVFWPGSIGIILRMRMYSNGKIVNYAPPMPVFPRLLNP